jgi:hypothetical protein
MTKLTKDEQELERALDEALGTPPKFSARKFSDGRHHYGDPEVDQFCAVMAVVMTYDPGMSLKKLLDEIDARVERAGGSVELAAEMAEAEFANTH